MGLELVTQGRDPKINKKLRVEDEVRDFDLHSTKELGI